MSWDKNKPAGSQKIRLSDDEIRANWAALEDALGRDHNFPGTEGVDAGEHNWVMLREQSSKPSVDTDKHALYAKSDGVYIEKEDGTEIKIFDFTNEQLVNGDIPSGEIILFEKDTVVVGYTLLTDKDDMVIYITKGSVAGGETGATDKSGGTWTQPDHSHSIPSHQHGLPFGISVNTFVYTTSPSTGSSRSFNRYASSGNGSYSVGRILTDSGGGGTTGSAATSSSWRPPGRNFTRQQRN